MPIDQLKRYLPTSLILEGLVLLGVAPWLLFPSQLPILTFFALGVTALLWLWPLLRRKKPFPHTPFNIAILFFEATILVGIIVTADPVATLPKATGVILGLTAWRFVVRTVRDKSTLYTMTAAFFAVGLGFIFWGTLGADWRVKAPFLEPILSILPSRLVLPPEAPAVGVHTNQLAGLLMFYLPIALSLAIGWRSDRLQKSALVILSFIAAAIGSLLILTQSRSGWIGGLFGIAAALLLWVLVLRPSRKRTAIVLSLGMMVLICLIILVSIGPDRMQNIWEDPTQETAVGSLGTINFRIEVWKWALNAIEDFPFTGTGLGTFRHVVLRLYPIFLPPGYDIAHAHNIFLQIALDTGLPGLVSYLSILMIAFAAGWRSARRNSAVQSLAIGLLASLVSLHVYGLTDTLALGSKPGLIIWMSFGLLAAMERLSRPEFSELDLVDPVLDNSTERR